MAGALQWFRRLAVPAPVGVVIPGDRAVRARAPESAVPAALADGVQAEIEAVIAKATAEADRIRTQTRTEAAAVLRQAAARAAEERAAVAERRRSEFAVEREELLAQGRSAAAGVRAAGPARSEAAARAVFAMLHYLSQSHDNRR